MTFAQYVDDLAKRGVIDGNIAENLMARHRDEAGNPYATARKAIDATLEEMWAWPLDGTVNAQAVRTFADTIDDKLESAGGAE